ncbi:MAG: amidase domain-containing protein [Methanosarcina sp.]
MKNWNKLGLLAFLLIVLIIVGCSTASATYDRSKAVKYAYTWGKSHNPDYHFFSSSGDCANFVSQCLYAGGWTMIGKEKDYQSSDAWYYHSWGPTRWWKGYSRTWSVANELGIFLDRHPERADSRKYIPNPIPKNDNWALNYEVGDVVIIDEIGGGKEEGKLDHAMIISKIEPNEIYLAAHTNPQTEKKISEIMNTEGYSNDKFVYWHIFGCSLTVTPTLGPQGTTFTFSGNGYTPNKDVNLYIRNPFPDASVSTLTKKADKTGTLRYNYPSSCKSKAGTYTIWAIDKTTGVKSNEVQEIILASDKCSISPVTLSVKPNSGQQGTKFGFSGSGYTQNKKIELHVRNPDNSEILVSTLTASNSGAINYNYPSTTANKAGVYNFWAIDKSTGQKSSEVPVTITGQAVITIQSMSPTVVAPGGKVTFVFNINNPTTKNIENVRLGAQIKTTDTQGEWIDDPANDKIVTLLPGAHDYSRAFKVSQSAVSGIYDARWVILNNANGNWFDSKTMTKILEIKNALPNLPVTLTVSPSSGQQGTTFTFSGNGYTPNGAIEYHVKKPDNTEYPATTLTASSSGVLSYLYKSTTASMVGTYTIWAIDKTTGKVSTEVKETITAAPVVPVTLTVSPSSGQQGTTFTFSGNGYTPNGAIEWHVKKPDNVEYPAATLYADASGGLKNSYTSTSNSMIGTYTIWAIDKTTGRQSNNVQETIT